MSLMLALALLTTAPSAEPVNEYGYAPSCARWTSRTTPPRTIRVFRADLHRVDRVPFRLYVQRVMASGAWPAYKPMESLNDGAIVVKQYAWYEALRGHRTGWGQCFDIRDGGWGQYYRSDVTVHSRIRRAVRATWPISLRKNGRFFRTGWRGYGGRCGQVVNGWHLFEDGVTDCARRGMGWRHILRVYLDPVAIR